jgi:hypothetical protein
LRDEEKAPEEKRLEGWIFGMAEEEDEFPLLLGLLDLLFPLDFLLEELLLDPAELRLPLLMSGLMLAGPPLVPFPAEEDRS